jgi:hypothetical protein
MTEKTISNDSTSNSTTNILENIQEKIINVRTNMKRQDTFMKSFVHAAPESSSSRKVP